MDTLEQARAEIDAVDAQLAALFERRMAAVLSVAQYKQAHGLPIFDAAREAAVLEKAAARIRNAALRPYYKDHVQNMMDVAKQYEAEVLGRNRAAYQGVEGAFAHIALRALFPHAEAVSYPTWDEVFDAVSRGDTAHGVVPFENSHAGDVSAVLDLCYNHPELWVVDVYDLPISQNLLVLPGTQLAQLKHVYSHQQAIAQSETFLKQFRLPATAMPNTAMAAKFVAESGDPSKAAIASAETAALYGLEVLVPSINTDGDNPTRFIVITNSTALKEFKMAGGGNCDLGKGLNGKKLEIRFAGGGTIKADSIAITRLDCEIAGSGTVSLSGKTEKMNIKSAGSSKIKAFGLETEELTCKAAGSTHIEITANKAISTKIAGSGTIRYKGNPNIKEKSIIGSGSITKVD